MSVSGTFAVLAVVAGVVLVVWLGLVVAMTFALMRPIRADDPPRRIDRLVRAVRPDAVSTVEAARATPGEKLTWPRRRPTKGAPS